MTAGPQGFCVSFFYALEGLSVDRLKVVIMDAGTQENITVWESQDNYDGRWTKGEVAYTYGDIHQVTSLAQTVLQKVRIGFF